ncbi:PLP-dependent aminotransferase family protein [archaeon]|nr:PLP-dependent aminotransferase family protein [archaeon]
MRPPYARRVTKMKASEIRELLKLTKKPDIISFAGGLPDPAAFPYKEVDMISTQVIEENYVKTLQYGTTEGFNRLRRQLAKRMKQKLKCNVSADEIIVTSGAQQAIDLVSKVFIDEGDTVLVEKPGYLGALSSFKLFQAKFFGIPLDEQGLKTEKLEEGLKKYKKAKRPFLYTVPTFQNPSGITMSLERRKHLMEIASEYDLVIVEDNPYSELRYSGKEVPTLKSMDTEGRVVYLGTLSKVFAPGMRLGWAAAPEGIRKKLVLAKQATDLCTSSLIQYTSYKYMKDGHMVRQIKKIKALYKSKRDTMLDTMDEYFPKSIKYNRPEGGMFLWLEFPKGIDSRVLFKKAIKKKVAFVPGSAFYVTEGEGANTARLNFSFASEEQIKEGIKRLSTLL